MMNKIDRLGLPCKSLANVKMVFGIGEAIALGGLGLSAYNTFGSSGGGGSVDTRIPLSAVDKQASRALSRENRTWHDLAVNGEFYPNLAAPMLQRLKQAAQKGTVQLDQAMSATASAANEEGGIRSGMMAGQALNSFMAAGQNAMVPVMQKNQMRREQTMGTIKQAMNIKNYELQNTAFYTQADINNQMNEARRTVDMSNMLWAGMGLGGLMYYNQRTR